MPASIKDVIVTFNLDRFVCVHCRYTRAERELKQARPYGEGATKFYAVAEIEPPKDETKELLIAMTSDRGENTLSYPLYFLLQPNIRRSASRASEFQFSFRFNFTRM